MTRAIILICAVAAVLPGYSGEIVGRVYEHCDRTPLTLVKAELKNGESVVQSKTVNADGVFRFAGVAPGAYVVEVSRPNYMFYPTSQSVSVGEAADGNKDLGPIVLYSSSCLATLKTEDLKNIAVEVANRAGSNRQALVANLRVLRTAVRSDEKADALVQALNVSKEISANVLLDAGFLKVHSPPDLYASPAQHIMSREP
jgi:hypothetical protein